MPRSRDIFSLIDYEAKRNPALAELVQRAPFMSDAEIAQAPVKLPWMRKALLALRQRHNTVQLEAMLMRNVQVTSSIDPVGEMRRWEHPNAYVSIGRGQLEIKTGDLLWIGADGVWIDTIRCQALGVPLQQTTRNLGTVTRSEYMKTIRNRLLHETPTEHVPHTQSSGVRFFRPA